MFCVDFAKIFCLGDMASFACHDQQLSSFLSKMNGFIDMIINGTV